ncbi:HD-GYP domain-containing protein [Paenibacillus sp. PL2-23]|uniref:HD-GYP domain-containing protein n=1 Tax=Paenibacillus sp. PL2-23 TaxID=2100729 RepID=UPI0030F5CF10
MEISGKEALRNCTTSEGTKFCPVSPLHYTMFWSGYIAIAAASVAVNVFIPNPYLLALFAIPAIYIGLMRMPVTAFLAGAAALSGLIAAVCGWMWMTVLPVGAFFALMLITRRIVTVSRRHFQQKEQYEELFMDTMLSFAKSIDTRDPYTAFHSRNVAEYGKSISLELGHSEQQAEAVYLAGLIHDIGKIGTPEAILGKESRLTEEEYAIMKQHPEAGYDIIKNIARLSELGITDMVRHHHERFDGRGYPHGLKGEAIPLGARILAAADAFDAMTTNRSYRAKLAIETAAEELRRHSGTQFDPAVAGAFLRVLEREGKLEASAQAAGAEAVRAPAAAV